MLPLGSTCTTAERCSCSVTPLPTSKPIWLSPSWAILPNMPPEVMKKLWDYIKANGLQDPKDKRTIQCDAKLKTVFGKDAVGMFELAGLIGAHLS